MPLSTQPSKEQAVTSAESEAGVLVVRRHHLLVRCSHWLNVPILLGLILSGISIYWASPVYQHKPNPQTGSIDTLADLGIWICAHVPGLHQRPVDWIEDHEKKLFWALWTPSFGRQPTLGIKQDDTPALAPRDPYGFMIFLPDRIFPHHNGVDAFIDGAFCFGNDSE